MRPSQMDEINATQAHYTAHCAGHPSGCRSQGPPGYNRLAACTAAVNRRWRWLVTAGALRPGLYCDICATWALQHGAREV